MADLYPNFEALAAKERSGIDYRFWLESRGTAVVIVAPHGGNIEPGTSQIAAAIARDDCSIYVFEGLRSGSSELHITSSSFDEPSALKLIGGASTILAIHGRSDGDDARRIWLGGLNTKLRDAITSSLESAGFEVATASGTMAGTDPMNICNRGTAKMGLQLELPRTLRTELIVDEAKLYIFVEAVREALASAGYRVRKPCA